MKYCISIFALPHEIDDLELTLIQLGKAFQYVDSDNFIFVFGGEGVMQPNHAKH